LAPDSHKTARTLERLAERVDLSREERAALLEAVKLFRAAAGAMPPAPAMSAAAPENEEAILFSDGAARGNPGPAGIGIVLKRKDGTAIAEGKQYLGCTTNNIAEYKALLEGLKKALEHGVRRLEARADSELVIKQLRGEYQVRNARLKPLFAEAKKLLGSFEKFQLVHVRREQNEEADKLANEAIDAVR
jgi:ribonuclease HI